MRNLLLTIAMIVAGNSFAPAANTSHQATTRDSSMRKEQRLLPETLTVAMTGDIMMGTTFPTIQLPEDNGRDIFRDTKEITQQANIAVGNLEGALCDGGQSTKGSGPNSYSFRMPTRFAPLLKEAGYDFLSMANNHARDFGDEGIVSTERALREQDIAFSGIEGRQEYAILEIDGVRYGLCAFGHNSYTLKHANLNSVKRIIDNLRKDADIVIVSFHGGAEGKAHNHLPYGQETFLDENRGDLRNFAHFCIDNGADIVYGHGPHVVRAVEVYKGHFIAYSLGNFCTPYGMNLSGISGYSPVVRITIGNDGTFKEGRIFSFLQTKGIGPRRDDTNAVAREIKQLTEADIKDSHISIDNEGNITLRHLKN